MLSSELLLPLSILHCQLIQRIRYGTAAYKSAPQWTIQDLNTVLSNMAYILSSCDGAEKITGRSHTLFDASIFEYTCILIFIIVVGYFSLDNQLSMICDIEP